MELYLPLSPRLDPCLSNPRLERLEDEFAGGGSSGKSRVRLQRTILRERTMAMMGLVTDLQNFLDEQIEGLKRCANDYLETGNEGWWEQALPHAFYFVKLRPQMRERVAVRNSLMAEYLDFCDVQKEMKQGIMGHAAPAA